MPERNATPRDDRTGLETPRPISMCPCGRAITLRGMCSYCLHAAHAAEKAKHAPPR